MALCRESPMPHPSVLAEIVLVAPGPPGPGRLAPDTSGPGLSGPGATGLGPSGPGPSGPGPSGPGPSGYLRVRLDRPERRNALDAGMTRALLDIVRADPAVPVLLESTNPAAFCAGADLTVPDRERAEVSDLLYQCYEAMVTRPGPVIAVVEGPAVGGGAQLAGAADLRIAGPRGRFRWAGPPGRDLAVGAWLLPDLIGRGAALELTLTGRWVEAAEAHHLGLANLVVDEPGKVAAKLARGLLARGTGAAGNVKLIASAGGLLDRLRAEREANRAAWGGA
jgi:enoyl-CoA hydratase/carnithine racemase